MFGRSSSLDFIHLVQDVYLEGTFKLCPPLFSQLFVVLCKRNGFIIPLAYGLLPSKMETSYVRFCDALKTVRKCRRKRVATNTTILAVAWHATCECLGRFRDGDLERRTPYLAARFTPRVLLSSAAELLEGDETPSDLPAVHN